MKYGYFDDERREYVITTPKTPLPWINYLGTEAMFGLISNTGGGYHFHRDAKLRRITRFRYNNIPTDQGGRCFYVKDGDSIWSPGWQPVKAELDSYICRHGLGYTVIESEKDGIGVEMLFFIPQGRDVEIQRVRVTNNSSESKKVSFFSFLEFCLWDALDDAINFQRNLSCGEVEVVGSVIYHKTEYRERRDHYAFSSLNRAQSSFDTDRETFIGAYGGLESPAAVIAGKCSDSIASGWSPVAARSVDLELAPGESTELIYLLGYVENGREEKFAAPGVINKEKAEKVIAEFADSAAVDRALAESREFWDKVLSPFQIECGDERLERMVNIWNPYQCMVTFNLSRSASYFESGVGRGMGFRDSNQDILGFVHQIPERARERILDLAATQLRDGGAYHQYQPLTKRGNPDLGDNFNDDPLWLILSTCAYVRETGDTSILDERTPYENLAELAEPLLGHLLRSRDFTLDNRGPHGLPLIGRADWNDCLNLNCFSDEPGESFQTTANKGDGKTAESVMIAGLFIRAAGELAELLDFIGEDAEAAKTRAAVAEMVETVNAQGRDKEWFLRAYDSFGGKVGSADSDEGKIFIESQGWCAMAGVGVDDGFAKKALDSVERHLATPHGIVLNDPPFTSYQLHLGEISSYPPGYKENGGIFCHANPWVIIAETVVGNNDRAFDYYKRIAPAWREEISDVHRCEPYVYAQMIAGKAAPRHGEAKNSWLTGTAAWNYVAIAWHILGVRAGYRGLVVDPRLPREIPEFKATRVFRGTEYRIEASRVDDPAAAGVWVDGEPFDGNEIPPEDKKTREVKVAVYSG